MPSLSSDNLKTTSSPYINRFLQPDSIIPDLSNPQSWNRYSYVTNRPVNFNDPSGHRACDDENDCSAPRTSKDKKEKIKSELNRDKPKDNSDDKLCVEIPLLCRGGQLNPLNYDTIGFQIKLNAKLGGGLEVNPLVLYWDGDDFRNFRLKEMAVGLGSSLEVSAGASLELFGGASLIGTDGSVLDQRGIGPLTVNAGGCIEAIAGCGKVSGSYSLEKQRLTYIEYSGGTGAGGDLSFGETITHLWFYKDKNNLWLNIPGFAPQNLPTTANPNP